MATTSEAKIRQELEQEREKLAEAVETLRVATDVSTQLRSNLPAAAAGAFAAGFLLAGGIGATVRLIYRRGRER